MLKDATLRVMNVSFLYDHFLRPRSLHEDKRRRELILNVFLVIALCLSLIGLIKNQLSLLRFGANYEGIAPYVMPIIFLLFLSLLLLSRLGFFIPAAYLLVGIYYASATYTLAIWGVDAVMGLLIYALVVVMASILISTRFSIISALVANSTLFILYYTHQSGLIIPDLSWKTRPWRMSDVILTVAIITIMVGVSWLSNRELERSLHRAQDSEKKLAEERDFLEQRVEERTHELKHAQLEKMTTLYRFAALGRLASGLFHDMIIPLNVVSLNLQQLHTQQASLPTKEAKISPAQLAQTEAAVRRALVGTQRMETFVNAVRRQLQHSDQKVVFNLAEECQQVLQILRYHAQKLGVECTLLCSPSITLFGNSVQFHQLLANLLTNAIDSYDDIKSPVPRDKTVLVRLTTHDTPSRIILEVEDHGKGIAADHVQRIFDPFFTTKSDEKGTGLGLAISKEIIEKGFGGTITITSTDDQGTTVTVTLPNSPHA